MLLMRSVHHRDVIGRFSNTTAQYGVYSASTVYVTAAETCR